MISVEEVTKKYGKKSLAFTALDSVSFQIPRGASVAIVGKSGSGKSTLMHVMSGLDKPDSGRVMIDDQDILVLKKGRLDKFRSQTIGFIFQSFFVQGNETCEENVSLPLEILGMSRSRRKDAVADALEKVDLIDKIKSRAKNLSGGQKQRLAIARAVVANPKIIFADEPTGNLDSVTGQKIESLLFNLQKSQGVTLVIVTHDTDLASRCDMQIHLRDGRIEQIINSESSNNLQEIK